MCTVTNLIAEVEKCVCVCLLSIQSLNTDICDVLGEETVTQPGPECFGVCMRSVWQFTKAAYGKCL